MKHNTAMQIDSPGRRAAAYWFVDGLPEIAFGLVYFIWGLLGTVWGLHLPNVWMKVAVAAAGLGFLILFWKDRKILDFFKARLTYPRTGYVRPPADPAPDRPNELITLSTARALDENVTSFRMRTVFVFFVAMAFAGVVEGRWSVPVLMVVTALLEYAWSREDVRPYSWWAVLPIALAGLLSAGVELPSPSRQYIPLVIGGAWLLAQGGWTLIRYLRAHPERKMLGRARS